MGKRLAEVHAAGLFLYRGEDISIKMDDLFDEPLAVNIAQLRERCERFINVTAVSRTNPAGGRFSGVNEIGPIPKDCDIHFEITNAYALPANSQIVWMVRNEGREAENINDLGHIAGRGLIAKERSAYRGTHHMDCFVKVAGQTVAMRRVPVNIAGQVMPRRNPLLRPEWVKLRGRK
jgi:hypothetical protein